MYGGRHVVARCADPCRKGNTGSKSHWRNNEPLREQQEAAIRLGANVQRINYGTSPHSAKLGPSDGITQEKKSLVSPIVLTSSCSTSTISGRSLTTLPSSRHRRVGIPLTRYRIVSLSAFATLPIASMSCSFVKLKMTTLSACPYIAS